MNLYVYAIVRNILFPTNQSLSLTPSPSLPFQHNTQGFDSIFVINATSANPGGTLDQGQIIIRGAEISQGTANVGIFNNGGLIAATGLNFATVTMLTAIESSNSALTSIEEFRVTASDIPVRFCLFQLFRRFCAFLFSYPLLLLLPSESHCY